MKRLSSAGSHRRAGLLPLLLLLSAAGACAAPSAGGSPEAAALADQRKGAVTGEALRKLLTNAYVSEPMPEGLIAGHPHGELFEANGSYARLRGWNRRFGMFTIEGDAVCVEGPGLPRLCRMVRHSGPDTYLFTDVKDGSSEILVVRPL
jgi:hypothetical protein